MTEQELYGRWREAVIAMDALRREYWATSGAQREGVWGRFRRAVDRRQDAEAALERAILGGQPAAWPAAAACEEGRRP